MNPWHSYWGPLDKMAKALRRTAGPMPFPGTSNAMLFVKTLAFTDMMLSDHECRQMWEEILQAGKPPEMSIFPQQVQWQSILRCEFACDFCLGQWGRRRNFDWTQKPEAIYRSLLIDMWRSDALFWASRRQEEQTPAASEAEDSPGIFVEELPFNRLAWR